MSCWHKGLIGLVGMVGLLVCGVLGANAVPYELTESEVQELSQINTPEVSLFGVKLGDSEETVKTNLIKGKLPGIRVEVQDVFVMLYDKKNPSNVMAGLRLIDGKVDYIFINQRFAHLATGVFRQILRGEGIDDARKLLGKEELAEDQTTFTRLNYKAGTMVIMFSGRDITVEFNTPL
jgi:hypothetical protein